jgi:glycine hydroxymethyltransferase
MAVYLSMLNPGDTVLAMDLSHGGHLTHGSAVNFSGRLFKFVHDGVKKENGRIDIDDVEKKALEHKPKMIVCGASAYPREIDAEPFHKIAAKVGALLMFDIAHIAGLIVTKLHKDPAPWCDFITTTTHKTLRGPRGGMVMCKAEHAKALDKMIFPGMQGGPLMHIIAAKAVAFKLAMEPSFKEYQKQTKANAATLAGELVNRGFDLVSGGTDNHVVLIDLRNRKLTGNVMERALDGAGLTVNKNSVPFDTEKPSVTSGIRIGTPAVTTRGFKEPEMKRIATWIDRIAGDVENESLRAAVKAEVRELCSSYPLFPDLA